MVMSTTGTTTHTEAGPPPDTCAPMCLSDICEASENSDIMLASEVCDGRYDLELELGNRFTRRDPDVPAGECGAPRRRWLDWEAMALSSCLCFPRE